VYFSPVFDFGLASITPKAYAMYGLYGAYALYLLR
jgi:hypothetical protein